MTFEQLMEKHPTEVVRHAIKGMMPNGKLGRQMYKKLKVTQVLNMNMRLRNRKYGIFKGGGITDGKHSVLWNRKKKVFSSQS